MSMTYDWHFPLQRTHQGMLLGNGCFGAMIWGEANILKITIGRADYWDRRGGHVWRPEMSFKTIQDHLARGDHDGLNAVFKGGQSDYDFRPSVMPIGRFEVVLARGTLESGQLDLATATCSVTVRVGRKQESIRLVLDMAAPVMALRLSKGLTLKTVRRVTSWDYVGDQLTARGLQRPAKYKQQDLLGWVQELPEDPSLCAAIRPANQDLLITAVLAAAGNDAKTRAAANLGSARFDAIRLASEKWWRRYWRRIGRVDIPNDRLQFLYDYGMYKYAGLTAFSRNHAVPATLQGPWIEEYQMPPWSSDYHFNINVQMCYWPGYHGNAVKHLRPLFDMVHRWTPQLRHNAKMLLGIDDGRLLPHAVSDECKFICGYWGHSVDHGSTAWVAQMMFRYYRYTLDEDFLREIAWPFMVGAMAVYEGMLEKKRGTYRLELGVSPEYFTPDGRGLGPNASFQLACIHRLAEDLLAAAKVLQERPKSIWQEYLEKIPRACVEHAYGNDMIMLWEGQALDDSHRHHSHLGGIVPFDIFDVEQEDDDWRNILGVSVDHWVRRGKGMWSGWCVPWAAMIMTRFNCGESAEMMLETWQHVFTNEGQGTLHDANIPGLTVFGQTLRNPVGRGAFPVRRGQRGEVMQMDAGMGVTAAIQEMLLHTRRGVNYIMAGTPRPWRDAAFKNFLTDGGFVVSAERRNAVLVKVEVRSPHGGTFNVANPWGGKVRVKVRGKQPRTMDGDILAIATRAGDRISLRPA